MPDVTIYIGGREFQMACPAGEEQSLLNAAAYLDAEAQPLVQHMGRLPESKLLLMTGLMLADKTAAAEEENRMLRAQIADLLSRPPPAPERIEVAVVPPQVAETLAEIAARAEALAQRVEEHASAAAKG